MAETWQPFLSQAPSIKASGLGVQVMTMSLPSAAAFGESTGTNLVFGYFSPISLTKASFASGMMS